MARSAFLLMAPLLVLADISNVWPAPQSTTVGSDVVYLDQNFRFVDGSQSMSGCAPVDSKTLQRFTSIALGKSTFNANLSPRLHQAVVCAADTQKVLSFPSNESYSITITQTVATVNAETLWGLLHGLETFVQLVSYTWEKDGVIQSDPYISQVPLSVNDYPYLGWRGMLIDSARHFLPVSIIFDVLTLLASNKFNVLHWHIVDAQSFPYQSTAVPDLNKAAYSQMAQYSPADVKSVVSKGLELGVRVIVEFDTPGHAAAWGAGVPGITSNCPAYLHNINNINLNPASPKTFEVLEDIIREAGTAFPDTFIHLGGDEVVQGCWSNDPQVAKWMNERGMSTKQVYEYFVNFTTTTAISMGKQPIVWQDVFDHGIEVPKETVIQVWNAGEDIERILRGGNRVILSASTDVALYFQKLLPNPTQSPKHYGFWQTYLDFYAADMTAGVSPQYQSGIIGVEGCLWGESIDETNILQFLFPRALAVAERGWTNPPTTSVVASRLDHRACVLRQRGFPVGPVQPGYCPGLIR